MKTFEGKEIPYPPPFFTFVIFFLLIKRLAKVLFSLLLKYPYFPHQPSKTPIDLLFTNVKIKIMLENWVTKSNLKKQTLLSLGSFFVGLLLIIASYNLNTSNSQAGFILGLFLFFLASYSFFDNGIETTIVDPKAKIIIIEKRNYFGTKKRTILFSDINDVLIGYLGRRSNYVKFYYIILKLKNKKDLSLFGPGYFYEGNTSRETIDGWRKKLEEYLGN